MTKTRILHIVPRTDIGGAEKQAVEHIRAGRELGGVESWVLTFERGRWHSRFEAAADGGVIIVPRNRRVWQDPGRLMTAYMHCRRLQPAIVYGWLLEGNLYSAVIGRGAKVVASERGTKSSEQGALQRWAEGWAQRRAARVIANSTSGVSFAVSKGVAADRVTVVPNFVERSARQPTARPERIATVGFLGRLSSQKGLRTLVAVRRALPPSVELVVAGPMHEYRFEELAVASLAGVKYMGPVETGIFLQSIDLLILPSTSGEGLSNVLLEACTAGVPFVTTDVGDNGRLARAVGMPVAPPHDAGAFAAIVVRVVTGSCGARYDARRVAEVLEPHRLETVRLLVVDIYRSMLSRPTVTAE